jgi:hypothetical protein
MSKTTQQVITVDQSAIYSAIEAAANAAPHLTEYIDARKKLAAIEQDLVAANEALTAIAAASGSASVADYTNRILAGEKLPAIGNNDSFQEALLRRNAFEGAARLQRRVVDELAVQVDREINTSDSVKQVREVVVMRISAALKELSSACSVEETFRAALGKHGAGLFAARVGFEPLSPERQQDAMWFAERRKEGYSV